MAIYFIIINRRDSLKYYKYFVNIGVSTVNLVDAALSARQEVIDNNEELTQENMEKYFGIF